MRYAIICLLAGLFLSACTHQESITPAIPENIPSTGIDGGQLITSGSVQFTSPQPQSTTRE